MMSLMRPSSVLREDFNRLVKEMEAEIFTPWKLSGRLLEPTQELLTAWTPPVDVIEEEKNIKVKALLPGFKPDDLEIEIESNMIYLSGEAFKEEEEEKGNFYYREIGKAKIYRKIPLPAEVQSEKAQAGFENGMLTITIPKSEDIRRHKIRVSRKSSP